MIISNVTAGERLDRFLASRLTHYSRTTLQRLITSGAILVNGDVVNKHYVLVATDMITVPDLLPQAIQFHLTPNPAIVLDVLLETPDFAVINKMAGLVVHPSTTHAYNTTVVNGALARWPEITTVGDDALLRPGIVHRLDRDVSGTMVIAKTAPMFAHLKRQFQDRTIEKHYLALVHGRMAQPNGVIEFGVMRSARHGGKMAAVPVGQGKAAKTGYTLKQQFQHYSLLDLELHTGRTHQIRVHLNAFGHPIVGDPTYHPKSLTSRLQPNRILLHAYHLGFTDLAGQPVSVEAPIPPDIQTILQGLTPYAG